MHPTGMNLTVAQIAKAMETWAPPAYAESYDNVGLLVGLADQKVNGVLVTLDVTEAVIQEAIDTGCNMVVAHHPIWFTPRKRLNGEDYVSRSIMKAVKHDIALYACHTNLDAVHDGVNAIIGRKLGAENVRALTMKRDTLIALVVAGAPDQLMMASQALEQALSGQCNWLNKGEQGRLEVILPSTSKGIASGILNREAPGAATYTYAVQEHNPRSGSGMIGELQEGMSKESFLAFVKESFQCGGIRYSDTNLGEIRKIAWCGGSGSFLIDAALRAGADAFVTADITYHKYFDNEGKMLLLDIGHFESEQFTSEGIAQYLLEKFPTFAVRLSKVITNPVKYY